MDWSFTMTTSARRKQDHESSMAVFSSNRRGIRDNRSSNNNQGSATGTERFSFWRKHSITAIENRSAGDARRTARFRFRDRNVEIACSTPAEAAHGINLLDRRRRHGIRSEDLERRG